MGGDFCLADTIMSCAPRSPGVPAKTAAVVAPMGVVGLPMGKQIK